MTRALGGRTGLASMPTPILFPPTLTSANTGTPPVACDAVQFTGPETFTLANNTTAVGSEIALTVDYADPGATNGRVQSNKFTLYGSTSSGAFTRMRTTDELRPYPTADPECRSMYGELTVGAFTLANLPWMSIYCGWTAWGEEDNRDGGWLLMVERATVSPATYRLTLRSTDGYWTGDPPAYTLTDWVSAPTAGTTLRLELDNVAGTATAFYGGTQTLQATPGAAFMDHTGGAFELGTNAAFTEGDYSIDTVDWGPLYP